MHLVVPADTGEGEAFADRDVLRLRQHPLRSEGPVVEAAAVAQPRPAGIEGEAGGEDEDAGGGRVCELSQGLGDGEGSRRLPDVPRAPGQGVQGSGGTAQQQRPALPGRGEEHGDARRDEVLQDVVEAGFAGQGGVRDDRGRGCVLDDGTDAGGQGDLRGRRVGILGPCSAPGPDLRPQRGLVRRL